MNKKYIEPPLKSSPDSLWQDAWLRLSQNKLAMIGLCTLVILFILCFVGPHLIHNDYQQQNLALGPTAPSATHWFGTDVLGRDLFARTLYGGRISFLVGLLATCVSLTIGVVYGIFSGYTGGRVDRAMMRLVEILQSLPFIIFVILLVTLFKRNFLLIFIAIGAVEWLTMARIIRGQTLSLKQQPFVHAALSLGQSKPNIMLRHLLPNLFGIIIVYATLTVPSVMLLEAVISFLGLGVQAPMTSWGDLIKLGAESMEEYPWLLIFPSLAFSMTLFSLNFLGDGLRDAFDPRANKN